VNFAVLWFAWRRQYGGLGGTGVVPQLGRVLAASAALALTAWGVRIGLARTLPAHGLLRQLALALGPIAAGAGVYFALARLLGVAEMGELARAARGRRPGARPPARP
jgi:putative peptidoglycan lipid II flippase